MYWVARMSLAQAHSEEASYVMYTLGTILRRL